MNYDIDTKCFANHMGFWCIEPHWFQQAIDSIKSGMWEAKAPVHDPDRALFEASGDGIAIIPISGPMMKGVSKFGGTSTALTRRALRAAGRDKSIEAILLHIDSPGGNVAGTQELADDVRAIGGKKPVFAHIDDLGASAALWVAAQAQHITANRTAEVGSIGVVAVVEDTSGAAEMEGVKVHVISTGEFKGAGAPGVEITEAQLADFQERVDDVNDHFVKDISRGRQMPIARVRELADGRVHIASKAQGLGLIDAVQSFDETLKSIRAELKASRAEREAKRAKVFSALDAQTT